MTTRTTRTTLTFAAPFKLRGVDGVQPAGDYVVVADDELIDSISCVAYRRVATMLCLPSLASPQTFSQLVAVNQTDLDVAVMKDRHLTL
jgi:hypothetical protein